MMGLVVPKIAHSFFGAVIEGVYNSAFENKYETILTVSQENAEREKTHLQTLVAMRVDGIIISISQETSDVQRFKSIRKLGIPLIFIDRRPEPALPGFSTILVDDRAGAFQAVEQAIRVGYRKLGLVGGNRNVNIGKERLQGFEEAMRAHRLEVKKEWIIPGGYGKDDGYFGMKRLHDSGSIPEFILAMTYPIALGIYQACRELGINIPGDVDIMCFGDGEAGRFVSPALSVVEQPAYDMGARAVKLLLDVISSSDAAREQHIVLPTRLVLRETCVTQNGRKQGSTANAAMDPTVPG